MDARLEKTWLEDGSQKPVKNQDLWMRIDEALTPHNVTLFWVKGHAGDEMNERGRRAGACQHSSIKSVFYRFLYTAAPCFARYIKNSLTLVNLRLKYGQTAPNFKERVL